MPKFLSMVTDADKIDTTSSINKFTTSGDISKLAGIAAGAQVNQNAFSNVAVSGQTTVAADAATDTLTLVAGENITITTDSATDSITIASSGSSVEVMAIYTEEFTATEGQTLFTLTSGSYTQLNDRLTIYIWGLRQHNTAFSETSTTSFTLAAGVPVGTKVLAEWRVADPILKGDTGTAATVSVGTTTTGAAGTNASVTNSGNSSAAVFNFTIPRGNTGATGAAATIAAGTVTTLAAGATPTVTNSGTSSAAIFNFGIPAPTLTAGYGDTTNPYASKTAKFFLAAPNAAAGVPTFRAIVASDIPTLNQSTTGTAANVTGTVAIANGGTGATTAAAALTNLGLTATAAELNFVTGVTSAIQTQLDAKLPLAGGTMTGKLIGPAINGTMDAASTASLEVRNVVYATGDAGMAMMSFHAEGTYAVKMGVRHDGVFGLGGWSRGVWSWYSDASGNMVAAGNVTAYSDPRLKENFKNIENPIEKVKSLNGGTFNWKAGIAHTEVKAGKKDYGILANEVEQIMPEIVTESIEIDGVKYKTVSYEKIVPLLIEAIKEQQKQIEELKALVGK